MTKWTHRFFAKASTDITDKSQKGGQLSVLSVPHPDLSGEILKNTLPSCTDITDKSQNKGQLSVLSVPHPDLSGEILKNTPPSCTDKTDRLENEEDLSVMSVPPPGCFSENSGNTSNNVTDKTDRLEKEGSLSVMSVPALDKNLLLESFEERLAIAEVEGQQPPDHAKRIATQDAFIMVLTSLPWEEDQGKKDWLNLRIKKSQDWLSSQNWEGLG